ncbi:hypothetical protein HDU93_007208 [Gonapodya sp. JEL0774]|nr:hypothetical protein HDU93_007208 [Gonapodya sp. JEL0774]
MIEAVEDGTLALLIQALRDGADPNGCKRVKVEWTFPEKKGGFFSDKEDVTVSDEVSGESALALAVLHGKVELAKRLLEAGAEPNASTVWMVPQRHTSRDKYGQHELCNRTLWNTERWKKIEFQSCLQLALCSNGVKRNRPGSPASYSVEDGRYKDDSPDWFVLYNVHVPPSLKQSHDMVRLLLSHNARVTKQVLETARALGGKSFLQLLDQHIHQQLSASETPRQRQQRDEQALNETLDDAKTTSVALQNNNTELERLQMLLHTAQAEIARLEQHQVTTVADLTDLTARHKSLEADYTALQATNDQLTSRLATLNTSHTALLAQHTTLQHRLDTALAQIADLTRSTADLAHHNDQLRSDLASALARADAAEGAAARGVALAPPVVVSRIVWAVAQFQVSEADEVPLAVGDQVFCQLEYGDGWGKVCSEDARGTTRFARASSWN